jgi:transposase
MANLSRPIVLSPADRVALEHLQRLPSAPAGLVRRARVVLLMADSVPGTEIARQVGYTAVQVSRIPRRFAEAGLAGLEDQPRSGRPPRVTERKTARIVALTLKPPPSGVTHWSTRDLADRVGVSHSTVHRVWRAHALQPRSETFKFSTDPDAEAKIQDVVGLYLHPPTNAVVLSPDEKTQIQALSRTQPLLPMRPGLRERRTHDYRRNGLTSLYAAFKTTSGEVIGTCQPRHTAVEFLAFLRLVARQYPM